MSCSLPIFARSNELLSGSRFSGVDRVAVSVWAIFRFDVLWFFGIFFFSSIFLSLTTMSRSLRAFVRSSESLAGVGRDFWVLTVSLCPCGEFFFLSSRSTIFPTYCDFSVSTRGGGGEPEVRDASRVRHRLRRRRRRGSFPSSDLPNWQPGGWAISHVCRRGRESKFFFVLYFFLLFFFF